MRKRINYLDKVNKNWKNIELCKVVKKGWSLNTREYKDPDRSCYELYVDLGEIYFKNAEIKPIKANGSYHLNYDGFKLSSDYIGPSIPRGRNAGIENKELINMLKTSRTIGGHILFPKGKGYTVNQARGVTYCDRLDLTLWAIKQWYIDKNVSSKIKNSLDRYSDWFSKFSDGSDDNGFNNFIKFNKLEEWVDKDGNIYNLVESDFKNNFKKILSEEDNTRLDKIETEKYRKYINNVNVLIEKRTDKLLKNS